MLQGVRIMPQLSGKRVLVGITGGIAVYKTAELVRLIKRQGGAVRVVMTEAAQAFVGPMTFQALSGEPVRTHLFDRAHEAAMGHIELARWPDLVVVAPASADFIARAACGMADDLLATLVLATGAPVAMAPAMNRAMWSHPATGENVARLKARGVAIWGPAEGEQACGDESSQRCRLLAQCGHPDTWNQCPLLGVKRTSRFQVAMSAFPKADVE